MSGETEVGEMCWARFIALCLQGVGVAGAGEMEWVNGDTTQGRWRISQTRIEAVGKLDRLQQSAPQLRRVTLYLNVWGRDEQPVTGLTPNEVAVFEDGVRCNLQSFQQMDEPLTIGLLLDTSASQRKHLAATLAALKTFIAASHPQNEFFLVSFDQQVRLQADFDSGPRIAEQLTVKDLGAKSVVYDALVFGLEKVKQGRNAKRALLLITDGQETGSRQGHREAIEASKHNAAQIYCLGVGNTNSNGREGPGDEATGRLFLEHLAALTGGSAFFNDAPQELQQKACLIAAQLRAQYRLEYETRIPVDPTKWRKVRLRLQAERQRRSFRATVRAGYYPNVQ